MPQTPRAAGAVFFLEDVGEPAYCVDRMLVQLERSGVLDGAVGLAFGRFTNGGEGPTPVGDVLAELAERLGLRAACDLPFGHVAENFMPPSARAPGSMPAGATLTVLEPAVR